ncbi:MAG: hypothetical protein NUV67_05480 [archaeon]|nr:hypothetical protein [archaeon]
MDKVHFSRAPSLRQIAKALAAGAREFYLPKSAHQRIGKKVAAAIEKAGAKIFLENARGRPIGIEMAKLMEIVELHRDHRTFREIEKITGVSKSTSHYLIKYAQRQKIRGKKGIVYL